MSVTHFLSAEALQTFETMPVCIAVLSPGLDILTISNAYAETAHTIKETIVGKNILEVFPVSSETREAGSLDNLRDSFRVVLATRQPHEMVPVRYDILDPVTPGHFITRYWQPLNTPVLNAEGEVAYIIHMVSDVTEKVNAEHNLTVYQGELEKLNADLEKTVVQRTSELETQGALLSGIISQIPAGISVITGRDMIVELANEAVLKLWGRDKTVIGKPLLDIMPEIKEQAFPGILNNVFDTGVTYRTESSPVTLIKEGKLETTYMAFSYTPLTGADGKVEKIMTLAFDVTEKTLSQQREQELGDKLGWLNKNLASSNEELAATNEELATTNEELTESNKELVESQQLLQQLNIGLKDSEARFQRLIKQATVGIIIINGPDMQVEVVSDAYGRLIGRTADELLNKPLFNIIPEAESSFKPVIDQVRTTGEAIYLYEHPYIVRDASGETIKGYLNLVYQPYLGIDGRVSGVMVLCHDITNQVLAHKSAKWVEDMLSLAIEAARIGSWHIDPYTKALNYNQILAQIFGYEGTEPMTYDMAIGQVTEEYRSKILEDIEEAIATGGDYDITYCQRRFNDGEVIWLRSLGKITQDDSGAHTVFSGVVMDITEQKKDDLRKNDFIGMVSHELKTPLTTLKAIIQLLKVKLKYSDDIFIAGAAEKADVQVKRMANMINGFLNISRLESGKILIEKQHFNIRELIDDMVQETLLIGSSHQLRFEPGTPLMVYADHDKISSVISNLLSNAAKYSSKGKSIEINCITVNGYVQVSIKDEGIGIKQEDLHKLFDRYYRVESDNTRHISGFGIGLYLSAEIIHRHDGKIWVESEKDTGSTFYFSLPL